MGGLPLEAALPSPERETRGLATIDAEYPRISAEKRQLLSTVDVYRDSTGDLLLGHFAAKSVIDC